MVKATIHLLSNKQIKSNLTKIIPSIDKDRLEKANRYVKENDFLLSLGGSYLINKYTGPSSLKYEKNGKPYKDGIEFSLSHSKEYVILATSDTKIGIDIEKIKKVEQSLISFCFNPIESKNIKTKEDFFSRWVNKESLGKCIGTGLKGKLQDIPSSNGVFNYMGQVFSSKSVIYKGYAIGACLKIDAPIDLIEIQEEKL